jgi:hypothetical protein
MRGDIAPLPEYALWRGAQLKHHIHDDFGVNIHHLNEFPKARYDRSLCFLACNRKTGIQKIVKIVQYEFSDKLLSAFVLIRTGTGG